MKMSRNKLNILNRSQISNSNLNVTLTQPHMQTEAAQWLDTNADNL